MALALGDVLANDGNFIQDLCRPALNDVGLPLAAVGLGVDNDVDSSGMDVDVNVLPHLHGVAIIMYNARMLAVDVDASRTERLDF